MHRRTLRCVSQAAPSRLFQPRTYHHVASTNPANEPAHSPTAQDASRKTKSLDGSGKLKSRTVQSYTEKIITAQAHSAKKPPSPRRVLERTVNTAVPSIAKTQFMAAADTVAEGESYEKVLAAPGSFIELRRCVFQALESLGPWLTDCEGASRRCTAL